MSKRDVSFLIIGSDGMLRAFAIIHHKISHSFAFEEMMDKIRC